MDMQIIGMKKLQTNLSQIAKAAQNGQSFTVVKHATPVFRIEPILAHFRQKKKKHTVMNFEDLQFTGGDPGASKSIDKIVYGV